MRTVIRRCAPVMSVLIALAGQGCHRHEGGEGHGHDHGHDHGAHEEAGAEERPGLSVTRWTDRYELFVEFPAPAPAKPIRYHAHVTRLADFGAVTDGTFRVRFKGPAGVVTEHSQKGVKRPGIFVFEGQAPAAGTYDLEMIYEKDGQSDVFASGKVTVAEQAPPEEEAPGSTISFLKESQWKIPFGTAWATERPLAKEMELAGTVEPAGTDQLTIGAPTGGRFFHNPKLSLAEGLRIQKGDIIGNIAPTVAGDDYSGLQFAVEKARLAKEQTEREIQRVEPLVAQNLLPEKRLIELRNDLQTQTAALESASGRVSRVLAPGGAGGLAVKTTLDGVISQVLVPNGEPVEGGAPLVRIGGTDHLWVRTRFVAKPTVAWTDPKPTAIRLATGERIELEPKVARFLSPLPVVDPASRVATWIVDVTPGEQGASLRPGASVVLAVRFGAPQTLLAVSKEAVVEINTRPFVFVQVDGEHFEKRAVTLGQTDVGYVHIVSGVAQGERIVTRGGFDIHLSSLMGTIESHRH